MDNKVTAGTISVVLPSKLTSMELFLIASCFRGVLMGSGGILQSFSKQCNYMCWFFSSHAGQRQHTFQKTGTAASRWLVKQKAEPETGKNHL